MITGVRKGPFSLVATIALALAVLVLVACGSSEEPATEAPAATAAPATATTAATAAAESQQPVSDNMAYLFTLPNARDGMDVSLDSYRGDRNVVLVFYRGFW